MSNIRIAIPSYKREQLIQEKTLAYLERCEIPKDMIDIFVANQEQYDVYREALGEEYNLIIGEEGLVGQRNFISMYYPVGQKVFSMDDDIKAIKTAEGKTLREYNNLLGIIKYGFKKANQYKTPFFAIHSMPNPLFMKNKTTTHLQIAAAPSFGFISTRDEKILVSVPSKEDCERVLRYYDLYGVLIRLNMFTVDANFYTAKGGLQESRDAEMEERDIRYLHSLFPHYTDIKKSKHSLCGVDLRYVDKTKRKRKK